MTTQFIPDVFEGLMPAIIAKVGFPVYFDFGHYREIVRNQTMKQANPTKPDRYPLLWLVMDIKEEHGKYAGIYADSPFEIIIAMDTTVDRTMQQRRDEVFIPILYPIYAALIQAILDTPKIVTLGTDLRHTKTDRPYWGGQDGYGNGEMNLFNDYIDALQIKLPELKIKDTCNQFKKLKKI